MVNNIVEILFENAESFPEKDAIIHKNEKISYGNLARDVRDYAAYFVENGLKKGDNVLIFVPMSIELYKVLCAVFYIGATAVFVDAWTNKDRLAQALTIVPCQGFIGCAKAFALKVLSKQVYDVPVNFMTGFSKFKPKSKDIQIESASADTTALITFTTGSESVTQLSFCGSFFAQDKFKGSSWTE